MKRAGSARRVVATALRPCGSSSIFHGQVGAALPARTTRGFAAGANAVLSGRSGLSVCWTSSGRRYPLLRAERCWNAGDATWLRRASSTAAAGGGAEGPTTTEGGVKRKVVSLRSPDGVHYQGEVNGEMQADGEGVLIQPDGSFHEGHWRNGAPHGWGRSVGADKWTESDGEWVAGVLHGKAKQRLRIDGQRTAEFDGEFYHGNRIRGTLRVSDGKVYSGEWTPNGALGRGKFVTSQGSHRSVMVGEWDQGGAFVGRITVIKKSNEKEQQPQEQVSQATEGKAEAHATEAPSTGHVEDEEAIRRREEQESEDPAENETVSEVSEGRFERGVLRRGRRVVKFGGGPDDSAEMIYDGEFDDQGILLKGIRSQHAGTNQFSEEGEFKDGFLIKGKQVVEGVGEAEGEWNPHNQEFNGKVKSANGNLEEGEFVQGRLKKGKRQLGKGGVFEGEWGSPSPHSFKGRAWIDDLELEGEFERDQLCRGRVRDRVTGREQEGEWRDGHLVQGCVRHPDGTVEEGEFLRGKMVRGRIYHQLTPRS